MEGKLIKTEFGYQLFDTNMAYITSLATGGLSLSNCQTVELGYDLDEIIGDWIETNGHRWSNNDNTLGDNFGSFKDGFHKAFEILGDKKFSEEDMKRLLSFVVNNAINVNNTDRAHNYIKSLQKNEWDVEILTYKDGDLIHHKGNMNVTYQHSELLDPITPKLDENGCYTLKRK